jgi:hypothetical protein
MKALVCSVLSAFLACPVALAHGGGGGGGGHMGGGGGFHSSGFSSHSSFSHTSSFGHSSFGSSYYNSFGSPTHAGLGTIPSQPSAHSIQTVETLRAAEAATALHSGFISPTINPNHLDAIPMQVTPHHGLMSGFGHGFARMLGISHPQTAAPVVWMGPAVANMPHPSFVSAFPYSQTLAVAMLSSPAFLHPNWMMSPYGYSTQTNSMLMWNNYNYNNYSSWNNWYNNPLPVTSFYSPYFAYPGLNALDATLAEAFLYPTFEPFPYFGQYFDRLDPSPWLLPGPNAISENYPVPLGTPFPVNKLNDPETNGQPTVLGNSPVIDPQLVPFDMSAAAH